MSKFHFHLQKVLDIKEKKREQMEWEYARQVQYINEQKEKLNQLFSNKNEIQKEIISNQTQGVFIAEMKQSQVYINYLDQLIHNQQNNIKEMEASLLNQQKELKALKIDEKKWENFREKKRQEFLFENNQKEQKELDEIANQRMFK